LRRKCNGRRAAGLRRLDRDRGYRFRLWWRRCERRKHDGRGGGFIGPAAQGANATAIGAGAISNPGKTNTTLVGANSTAEDSGGTAIGTNAVAGLNGIGAINATAVGNNAFGFAANAVAVGSSAQAGTLALSGGTFVNNSGTTAIGSNAQAGTTAAGQTNATAVGFAAMANAAGATALGANSTASGASSLALGNSAVASANAAIAVGLNASATGANAIAIGTGATATGSIAVGNGASAGNGGAAFGDGASATFANSAAIGPGAVATRANQVAVGTASNTYTLAGISSAASLAAQTGPLKFVTSDANGNLATSSLSVPDVTGLQTNVALLQGSVGVLQQQMRQSFEGTAIAVAMGGSALPSDKRFAISSNWGTFRGQNAGSFLAQARVNDYIVLNGGVGFGFAQGGVAGRAGVTFAW